MKEIFLTVDMDLSPAQMPPMLPKKNFFMNWICLRNSTKRLPYMEETAPVSAFCMSPSLFIFLLCATFTAEIWIEIVTDISEMHTKISDYLNEFQA